MSDEEDYQANLDTNFIENALPLLGVRLRRCELCGKRIITQIPKLDRFCEECSKEEEK